MLELDGIWRLIESRAWDANGRPLPAPYGAHPLGQLQFAHGRMLAVLCNGDAAPAGGGRPYSSYGGPYVFDGEWLTTTVDVASDPTRLGSRQRRRVVALDAGRIALTPPPRGTGAATEQRELLWERVWSPPT